MSSLNLVSWEQNKPKKLLQIKEVSRFLGLYNFKKKMSNVMSPLKMPKWLIVPCFKSTTRHGLHSFRHGSTTIWNRLPEDVRSTTFFKEVKIQKAANFAPADMIIQVIGSWILFLILLYFLSCFVFFFLFPFFQDNYYYNIFFLFLGDISFYSYSVNPRFK